MASTRFDLTSAAARDVIEAIAKDRGVRVLESRTGPAARLMETRDAYEIRVALPHMFARAEITAQAMESAQATEGSSPGIVYDHLDHAIGGAAAALRGQVLLTIADGDGGIDFTDMDEGTGSPAERAGLTNARALRVAQRLAVQIKRLLKLAADATTPDGESPMLAVARDAFLESGSDAATRVLETAGIDPTPHIARWRSHAEILAVIGKALA